MRELKFRAWDKVHKTMHYDNFWTGSLGKAYRLGVFSEIEDPQVFTKEKLDWELTQFTGLKDKNGKEIYEGDIVSFKPKKAKIVYSRAGFYVEYDDGVLSPLVQQNDFFEVIGNLFENPELLKGKS